MRNIILQTLKLLVSNGSTFWPQKSFIILFNEKYFFLPCLRKTQFRFEFGSIRKLCFEIWIDFCNETWTWPLKVWQIESQVEYVTWFLKFKCPHAFRLRFLTKVFFLIVGQELEIIQWFYMLRFFVKFK